MENYIILDIKKLVNYLKMLILHFQFLRFVQIWFQDYLSVELYFSCANQFNDQENVSVSLLLLKFPTI